MRLHRVGIVAFDSPPPDVSSVAGELGPVSVSTSAVTSDSTDDPRCLVVASVDIDDPIPVDDDGYLALPEEPRRACEQAIETTANILSVIGRTGRRIASAFPPVALSNLSDEDEAALDTSRGFRSTLSSSVGAASPLGLLDPGLVDALTDRLVGVALLTEVLSSSHVVAKFRALVRLFENALARPSGQMGKKLYQLLAGSGLGYTHEEVKSWLALRDGVTHGDLRKASELVGEHDIRPLLFRMEQAAFDVLFNKDEWHSPSSSRRSVLTHNAASTGDGELRASLGTAATISFQLVDPFGVFPMDLTAFLNPPPASWWWQPSRRG